MDRLGMMLCTVAALGLLAGCGGQGQPREAAAADDRLDLGVVGVSARIGDQDVRSSGFVIDGDRGLVLTSAHGVWGARSLRLATALGVLHGRIVARAPCDDLAVLEVHPRIPGLAALPSAPAGPAGDLLLRSVGRRHDGRTSAMASIPVRISTTRAANVSLPLPSAGVALDSPLVPEVSGGPVVDPADRLVGMAESIGASSTAVTVPWSHIRERLAQLKPGPRRVFVGWKQQYRCVGRQHAFARRMHPGYRASDARLDPRIEPTRIPGAEGLDG